MYDRVTSGPGQNLKLGTEGGVLLLGPPGAAPGAMSLTDMQNRTWHLLREDGPDTGLPAPTTGDFPITVVTRDLNIALADFLSQTGIAPGLCERMDTFPVYAGQDAPVPPGLQSITQIEYNPYGGYSYFLQPASLTEFVNFTGGLIPPTTGRPKYYREPFAGFIRLQPAPSQGQAVGPAAGTLVIGGTPTAGQQVTVTLVNGGTSVTTSPYTVKATDTNATIAQNTANLVAASAAASGGAAFVGAPGVNGATITVQSLTLPGTQITIAGSITSNGATITPTSATNLTPTGDTMTWYYTSVGNLLIYPGDTPAIPPQFHMSLVYRVLADYWERKQDGSQADRYMKKFEKAVARGKAYTFDSNRASQPTTAGDDYEEPTWPLGGA